MDTNEECDCTDYKDAPDQSGYCSDCYHRRKAHLVPASAPAPTSSVKALLAKMLTSGGKGKGSGKSGQASSSRKILPNLSAANRESNAGLRPGKEAGPSKPKTKKKDGTNIFKVVSIAVVPHGTKWDLESDKRRVVQDKAPNNNELLAFAERGLAVVDSDKGFELDRTWTHKELVNAFTGLLPLPFSFFEQLEDEADDGQSVWRLASVVSKRLEVVQNPRPTGKEVDFLKGNSTTGFRACRVFVVALDPIPASLLKEWAQWSGADTGPSKLEAASDDVKLQIDDDGSQSEQVSESDVESSSGSPEKIPQLNKRRLFSKGSSDDDEVIPAKKKGKGPAGRTWIRKPKPEDEYAGSDGKKIIDLTADDAAGTTGAAKQDEGASNSRASSEESVYEDPLIGDPYEKSRFYEF
ncbi:hypothetical protein C8R47DRAFT_1299019 [Mycena vitilis]|nr:hypothetical protein C8R47DRAFT_1299019 [Mycena vitilis]